MYRTRLAVLAVLALAAPAPAAVIVVANAGGEAVRFTTPGGGDVTLAPGESKPLPCGRLLVVTYLNGGKPVAAQLDAYAAYVFITKDGRTELHAIELAGKPVPIDDVPEAAPPVSVPLKVPVRLLADDADRRTRVVWETALRKRFEEAANVVVAHAPVRFEVTAVDAWASDPAADLDALYTGFVKALKPDPAKFAVGYTSRTLKTDETRFAVGWSALGTHALVREWMPRSEAERVEVLVSQLGRYLGAVTSPDPGSAMRPKLGDGKAAFAQFRVGFDPLNVLAMNLWAEEVRAGKTKWTDFRPRSQARLGRVYATLAAAMPDEPVPDAYAGLVALANPAAAADPRKRPEPPADDDPQKQIDDAVEADPKKRQPAPADVQEVPDGPPAKLTPKQEQVRKVIRAVVQRGEQNAAAEQKLRGDELTAVYVKAAADVARMEEKKDRAAAFVLGLGVALDDSEILRKNPVMAAFCKAVETDAERRKRLAVLGLPTVRHRRDLCQHFVVSAALTEFVGADLAEKAGIAKELLDMNKPSGFSFTDLCADLAGIEFARLAKGKPELLDVWWREFAVGDFVPPMDGLRDAIPADRFRQDYGSITDERFTAALEDVRKRVKGMKRYANLGP